MTDMAWDLETLRRIANKALENGVDYFELAERFAEEKRYGIAYSMLIFSIEELAKQQICDLKATAIELAQQKKPDASRTSIIISDKKMKELFYCHPSKRVTILAQLILGLGNTPDLVTRQNVWKCITTHDSTHSNEVKEILRVYRKIPNLREMGLYVGENARSPRDFRPEDYFELFTLLSKLGIKNYRHQRMHIYPNEIQYEKFEDNVAALWKKFDKEIRV